MTTSDRWTGARYAGALAAVSLLLAACGEQRLGLGVQRDTEPPAVVITKTAGDTMDVTQNLRFGVGVTDNLGIKTVSIQLTGGYTATLDTTMRTAVTTLNLPINVDFPNNTSAGGWVYIRTTATDGNNNSSVARDSIFLTNIDALIVTLVRPAAGSIAAAGRDVLVQVNARQRNGVTKIGWTSAGVVVSSDSTLTIPAPDTNATFIDTLSVPSTATGGTFTVTGFAVDSLGRRVTTPAVTITIQSVANDTTPPNVTFNVLSRVEVRDSITVRATDPSGITLLGWVARDRSTNAVVGGDSLASGGTLTDVINRFNLNFSFTTFPQSVIISAFAVDAAGNRAVDAKRDTTLLSPIRRDTVTVVNGITRPLPAGGQVVDGIYNRNLDEIYLTNIQLDRVEIFRVTDTAFVGSIAVGSRPWGIALWPRDTLGANADTIVVANSGGTNLSIVNVQTGVRRQIRRHILPNFVVQGVVTTRNQTTGVLQIRVEEHDFSDRPQYLATTCRPSTGTTNCASDSIFAVFSTAPTPSQVSSRYANKGTVRWDQIGTGALRSHFFWEHAAQPPSPETDSLQVIVDRGPGTAPDTIVGAGCGRTVLVDELAFADTTFVRNSGNFTHALLGESGNSGAFARSIGYNGTTGVARSVCPAITVLGVSFGGNIDEDFGISPSIRVQDFIGNTATRVRSIGINFNGRTNLIRADSVYILNEALRLQGLLQVPGGNAGMDLNFDHAFDAGCGGTAGSTGTTCSPNGLNPDQRLLFTARPDNSVDVYDTFFYGKVATIPLRDPIIGTLRVARLASGEQVIIGVTSRGVVVARLAPIANVYGARAWGPPLP